ncbi:unnamed protein product [marine sediment metagenome]|uniref:Uncharacterized protein n=1 Tax=marine sediment metagenome TaxID=412755 RepID=X1DX12_9ZZZZ
MSKQKLKKSSTAGRRRTQAPKIVERNHVVTFECPFCFPPHPLMLQKESHCGTMLELKAIQRLYKGVKCAKCGESGGTLSKVKEKYQHAKDCLPGSILLPEDPVPSTSAKIAYYLPQFIRQFVSKRRQQVASRLNHEGEIIFAWLNI